MELGFFAYNLINISKQYDNKIIEAHMNTNVLISATNLPSAINSEMPLVLKSPKADEVGTVVNFINNTDYDHIIEAEAGGKKVKLLHKNQFSIIWTGLEWKNMNGPAVGDIWKRYPGMPLPEELYPFAEFENFSQNYADAFFRVEGTKALAFSESLTDKTLQPSKLPNARAAVLLKDSQTGNAIAIDANNDTGTENQALYVNNEEAATGFTHANTAGTLETIKGPTAVTLDLSRANSIYDNNAKEVVVDNYTVQLYIRRK